MAKTPNQKIEQPDAEQAVSLPSPSQAEQPAPPSQTAQPAVPAAAPPTLAQEAEAFCQDLERFFRRAFGDLPKAADLSELRAEQATVRDLLRRATEAGGESGAKLTAMTAERDKLKAGLLQSKADFLNFQARAGKDLTRAEELALRRYMQDMLPILDSLKLALRDAASPEIDTKRLKDALLLIDTSLNQALSVRGLQRIAVEAGTPYDANLHEAVAMRPADAAKGEKPNTVLEELRPGYLWKGLVLRPPQVLISEPEKQAKKQ